MNVGDLIVREMRAIHSGTPAKMSVPRPVCVNGESRRWLKCPKVSIRIPQATRVNLSDKAQPFLRFNSFVESLDEIDTRKVYPVFVY